MISEVFDMIRFRNPGTQFSTQVQVFKELYKEYKDAPSFDLDDMAETITKTNLMTAYGYAGDAALALSDTENKSLNSTQMNAKMYAEVFRLYGWVASSGVKSYPLIFTYIGEHVATSSDVLPLFEQCILGINNPQEIMNVKYTEKSRIFKAILFSLEDLEGIMYKHELCYGPMSVDDLDEDQYNSMIKYLKEIRGSHKRYQEAFARLCKELNVKPSLPDNCTRLPIAVMKICNWVEGVSSKKIYPPKTLECIALTEHGREITKQLHNMKDLRLDEYNSYPESTKKALIRLGVYSMLYRAGYDTKPVKEIIEADTAECNKILQGKQLLFSPYQTLRPTEVEEALGIERSSTSHSKSKRILPNVARTDLIINDLDLSVTVESLPQKEDAEVNRFVSYVKEMKSTGKENTEIIDKVFEDCITNTQTRFYPFVAMLFRVMGLDCTASRPGDNGARWDAIIVDEKESIPIEIKSPTEEQHISLKAIRQALENKVILLSRKTHITQSDTTSLAVGYYLPNDRAEVTNLMLDFKNTYGFRIGVIDLKTLLTIAITIIIDGKTIDIQKLNRLEGFANATFV